MKQTDTKRNKASVHHAGTQGGKKERNRTFKTEIETLHIIHIHYEQNHDTLFFYNVNDTGRGLGPPGEGGRATKLAVQGATFDITDASCDHLLRSKRFAGMLQSYNYNEHNKGMCDYFYFAA